MPCALRFRYPHAVLPGWAPWLYVKTLDLIDHGHVGPTEATTRVEEAVLEDEVDALLRARRFVDGIIQRGRDPERVDLYIVDLDADLEEVPGSARRIGQPATLPA